MSNKAGELNGIEVFKIRAKILEVVVIGGITHNGTTCDVIKKCKAIEKYILK